jgi:hypothetical protein
MYGNNSIYNSLKKNQMPRSKLNKGCEWPLQRELQMTEERDWGRQKKVNLTCSWMGETT